jgi:hypothetical protein
MGIDPDQKFTLSKDVLFQDVSGETVLLDLVGEQYFGLNQVGTRVWQLLAGDSNFAAIIDVLLEEYEVSRQQLERDVRELLGSLLDAGLIKK